MIAECKAQIDCNISAVVQKLFGSRVETEDKVAVLARAHRAEPKIPRCVIYSLSWPHYGVTRDVEWVTLGAAARCSQSRL